MGGESSVMQQPARAPWLLRQAVSRTGRSNGRAILGLQRRQCLVEEANVHVAVAHRAE